MNYGNLNSRSIIFDPCRVVQESSLLLIISRFRRIGKRLSIRNNP